MTERERERELSKALSEALAVDPLDGAAPGALSEAMLVLYLTGVSSPEELAAFRDDWERRAAYAGAVASVEAELRRAVAGEDWERARGLVADVATVERFALKKPGPWALLLKEVDKCWILSK